MFPPQDDMFPPKIIVVNTNLHRCCPIFTIRVCREPGVGVGVHDVHDVIVGVKS